MIYLSILPLSNIWVVFNSGAISNNIAVSILIPVFAANDCVFQLNGHSGVPSLGIGFLP